MAGKGVTIQHEVHIPAGEATLEGILTIPADAKGLVLFAHGSGSSRFSPRNQFVARSLQEGHLATLLFDLLTEDEEAIDLETAELRFDIPFLAKRLAHASTWVDSDPETKQMRYGFFGSSTGAAAALIAAAELGEKVGAVVSRGGRPDLAAPVLPQVVSPTLLIVGGNDLGVIELNQEAYDLLGCEKKLEIVPGATHLFQEHGALERVAQMASRWFQHHL